MFNNNQLNIFYPLKKLYTSNTYIANDIIKFTVGYWRNTANCNG